MTTDYVYNVVVRLLSVAPNRHPHAVVYNELAKAIQEDLQDCLNELVAEKRLAFRKNVNGIPMFYAVAKSV